MKDKTVVCGDEGVIHRYLLKYGWYAAGFFDGLVFLKHS